MMDIGTIRQKQHRLWNTSHPAIIAVVKYSTLEGGTRVPFIAYWPKEIKQRNVSDVLFSQIDLLASFAKMLNQKLPKGEFTDSHDHFATMIGKENKNRDSIIEQPANGALCIIKDGWKYITPGNGMTLMKAVNIETGYSKEDQLYNLKEDPLEWNNLALKYPQKVTALKAVLEKIKGEY